MILKEKISTWLAYIYRDEGRSYGEKVRKWEREKERKKERKKREKERRKKRERKEREIKKGERERERRERESLEQKFKVILVLYKYINIISVFFNQ